MRNFIYTNTDFVLISYFYELQTLKIVWKAASNNMSEEDFKQQIEFEKEAIIKFKPTYILANTVNFFYTISSNLQHWHNDFIFPTFEAEKVEKLAIILSQNFFAQLSIEQLINDANGNFITQYFDSESLALDWFAE